MDLNNVIKLRDAMIAQRGYILARVVKELPFKEQYAIRFICEQTDGLYWDTAEDKQEFLIISAIEKYIKATINENSGLEECLDLLEAVAIDDGFYRPEAAHLLEKYRPKKSVDHGFTDTQKELIAEALLDSDDLDNEGTQRLREVLGL